MSVWRRTIRTSPRSGLSVSDALAGALTSELLCPSPHLWLVSPWISDIPVLDNGDGHLDAVLGDGCTRGITLSEVMARLARMGSQVHVATRPDDHNRFFLDRLARALGAEHVLVHRDANLHEKTLCGSDWMITGSMNFTWRGLEVNEEAVTYTVDPELAAQARVEFEGRWAERT